LDTPSYALKFHSYFDGMTAITCTINMITTVFLFIHSFTSFISTGQNAS